MRGTLAERFEAKVERETFVRSAAVGSPCWRWTGAIQSKGYGLIRADGKPTCAHRVSYELYVGRIPDGEEIDHLCRWHPCVNPSHLEVVTRSENVRRGERPAQLARENRDPTRRIGRYRFR